ncbi:MAG: hypothetical protein K5695_00230 [Oscillospiraceae bacterium]|nr:hypothetical protein [Oscillospiraceae bacterium]
MAAKILMLVEGAKTDVKLMRHLVELYGIAENHVIVSYNTNIYTLYKAMFIDNDPETVDLLQLLKSREQDPEKKLIFDEHYSDILLVFDLDPQDPTFSQESILEMQAFFTESSDMGKLYLNYPMVESFYHMKAIPDPDYHSRTATLDELRKGTYKSRVNAENRNRDYTKFAASKAECSIVIRQNLEKGRLLANDTAFVPDSSRILEAGLTMLSDQQMIFVLCTCVYYIAEYSRGLLDE